MLPVFNGTGGGISSGVEAGNTTNIPLDLRSDNGDVLDLELSEYRIPEVIEVSKEEYNNFKSVLGFIDTTIGLLTTKKSEVTDLLGAIYQKRSLLNKNTKECYSSVRVFVDAFEKSQSIDANMPDKLDDEKKIISEIRDIIVHLGTLSQKATITQEETITIYNVFGEVKKWDMKNKIESVKQPLLENILQEQFQKLESSYNAILQIRERLQQQLDIGKEIIEQYEGIVNSLEQEINKIETIISESKTKE